MKAVYILSCGYVIWLIMINFLMLTWGKIYSPTAWLYCVIKIIFNVDKGQNMKCYLVNPDYLSNVNMEQDIFTHKLVNV
jgi:hypothetical protein